MPDRTVPPTPGPWIVRSGSVYHPREKGVYVPIAHMDRNTPETAPAERDSNAYMCAAAPEMLAACERALAAMTKPQHPREADWAVEALIRAIKLARGNER